MKFSLWIIEVIVAVVVGKYVGVVFGGESNYDASNITIDAEGEKVSTEIISSNNNDGYYCDESKCVSTGLTRIFLNKISFTCYTDGSDIYPMMCSDGYKPRIVENETTVDIIGYDFQYFTCCPPNLSPGTDVGRHCSNPIWYNSSNNDTMVCDDTTKTYLRWGDDQYDDDDDDVNKLANKPYPRKLKRTRGGTESYICCDSIINGNENGNKYQTNNFLDEIECVPYINEFYEQYAVYNAYGRILPAYCDEPESGFHFPRYVEHNKTSRIRYYECCKTGPGSPPFIQDSIFKITVYPQIAISAIAVISSMVLIIALLIPLFRSLRLQSIRARTTARSTNARTRTQAMAVEPAFSSYNLYLVYLAIPDLMLNLYLLIMYGSYANQKFNPNFSGTIISAGNGNGDIGNYFEGAFIIACSTANLYLNCVVFHEILILLRKSHQVIRYDPPSLLKVTLQAMAVYLFSIIVFIIHYFIGRAKMNAANLVWSFFVTYFFPVAFFLYVWITIKCRGYMPSVTGKMKQLVYFFFRIVFVFCLIWLPGMVLVVIGASVNSRFHIQIGLLFCGIQPIVSMCIAMTKSDVRKYTMDLITLSYICTTSSSSQETRTENTNDNSS